MNNYLITIIGPTAIGKTSLSITLAQHFNCDIISCDSRQFFKEMKIGTAVPSDEELASATHHFIQNKSIFDNYSVGDFEKEVIEKLEKAIDLPVRLVSDMKKEDLDIEQKLEIVSSEEPKEKFKEIKEEIYGKEPEKNEVEVILDKIHKAEITITKQEEKIERLKTKLERLRDARDL